MGNTMGPLRVAAGHHHFDHRVAVFCGLEFNWFDGADVGGVTVTATGHDGNSLDGLLAGRFDLLLDVAPDSILRVHVGGESLVILGSVAQGVNQILIGVPGLKSIADIPGKRISVVENGTGVDWKPLRILLRRSGVDPDRDVSLVPRAPFPVFAQARVVLDRGDADARMLLHTERPIVEAAGYPILFDFHADYPSDFPQRTIVTTRAFYEANRERIDSFMEVLVRGYRYVRDKSNFGRVMEITRGHFSDSHLGFPPGIPENYFINGFDHMPADADMSLESLQRAIDEEVIDGAIAKAVPASQLADLTSIRRAAAALDARFGPGRYM